MNKSIVQTVVAAGLVWSLGSTDVLAGGRDMHYYRGDHWVRNGWFGLASTVVGALAIGAICESLPPRHTTVIVGNEAYYYHDGTYFRPAPGGYVVVPAPMATQPVVVVPPAPTMVVATPAPVMVEGAKAPLSVNVNIPNAKGTYTTVTLTRSGTGFVGPQGEYYPEFPKVEQLRLMYGL